MLLDMLELRRLLERRHVPVQISEPAVDGGIAAADVADVAFEVRHVDGIEADGGHVQAHVRFGESFSEVVRSLGRCGREPGFGFVEVGEEVGHGGFVGLLRTGGSGLARRLSGRAHHLEWGHGADILDAVVDVVVGPSIVLVDFTSKVRRIQIHGCILFWKERIECSVQHADDLAAFIVHDRAGFLVPQHGHSVAARVIWVVLEVELLQVLYFGVERVGCHVLSR